MKTIIYIAGLYHSGSTLLDSVLSQYSNVLGLGEIYKQIIDGPNEICSCSNLPRNCIFWSYFYNDSICFPLSSSDVVSSYSRILQHINSNFPQYDFVVDSSKSHPFSMDMTFRNFRGLVYHTSQQEYRLKVIHLYRDPRSWVNSILAREHRSKRSLVGKFLFNPLFNRFARYFQWYFMHKRISKFLTIHNIDHLSVSYEELCFDSHLIIKNILNFLEFPSEISPINSISSTHILVGNPARFNKPFSNIPKYDSRWLARPFHLFDYIFSLLFSKMISQYVYPSSSDYYHADHD